MEHPKYSAEWIKATAQEKSANWLDHHDCSICGAMVGYSFDGDDVHFHSGCDCSYSPPRQSSYSDIASWLAMQSSDDIRDRIMCGLLAFRTLAPTPSKG